MTAKSSNSAVNPFPSDYHEHTRSTHTQSTSDQAVSNNKSKNNLIELVDVSYYEKREHIHTRSFTGLYRRLRLVGGGLLFALYFGTLWLDWNGRQAVLFDIPQRQFHIFGSTFWAQDFYLLGIALIICAFGLFAITVYAGRVWCGYTCPQSVWTWMFMWAEKVTEGDRNQRIKLSNAEFSVEKSLRHLSKHSLWILISAVTAFTFVGYFFPVKTLSLDLLIWEASGWAVFWILFFAAATYINAGWLREQVCLHMCPYSRFQSVMFDKDTLVITYDAQRGEGRGARRKETDYKAEGLGDCIDCKMCVQVCPTGIDIRDGLQLECIGCAACIDACDSVMEKMEYPKGLVRYATENELSGTKSKILRPRMMAYAFMLIAMVACFGYLLSERELVELSSVRDRDALFSLSTDGLIENIYNLQVGNKDQQTHIFDLSVIGLDHIKVLGKKSVQVTPGEVINIPMRLQLKQKYLTNPASDIMFQVKARDNQNIATTKESRFIGPFTLNIINKG